ncbi:MAG: hypothetical protein M1457_05370 [bacterium]|nr:hypothetical protein [bacterium]
MFSTAIRQKTKRINLWLLAAGLAMLAALAAAPAAAKSPKAPKPPSNTPNKNQTKFEIGFLQKQIDFHQRGIALAMWIDAQTTGTQTTDTETSFTELRLFVSDFLIREQNEQATMLAWLQTWYGITYIPKSMSIGDAVGGMMKTRTDLQFISGALGALMGYESNELAQMKQVVKANTKKMYHMELKTFATDILIINQDDIMLFKDWKRTLAMMAAAGY